jgi:hypothetical protein
MDARRFDLLARGVARLGSRRSFLRSVAIAAGGTIGTASSALALASDSSGVGGSTSPSVCPPSRRPTKKVSATAPFPAFIVGGTCDHPDLTVSYNLIDAGAETAGGKRQGAKKALVTASSATSIRVRLADLLANPHAIVVRADSSGDDLIACGEIGGVIANKTLAMGLQERNGSGYAGVASLTDNDPQTMIALFVAQDLFELVDSWEGQTVVATDDINLRDSPSEDGKIIAVLGAGSVMTVTGPAEGEWLPVTVAATGDSGYVSSRYVDLQ